MRVLVFTNMHPSEDAPHYAPFVPEQVKSLRMRGIDVDVLEFNPRRSRLNYARILPRLRRTLKGSRYDIVHTHHSYSLLVARVARSLAGVGIPLVLTSHEAEATDRLARTRTWHPSSRLRHALWLKRLAARQADFVVFVSRQLAEIVRNARRHEIIPCGVDLDRFRPLDRPSSRRVLGIPLGAAVVFFPANPSNARKRFSLAGEAFERFRKSMPSAVLLTAAGVPYENMPLYFNAADVVIQTSFAEASPAVVKEALACEVPVVSTDTGDTREIVEGVANCFICREDPDELAERLRASLGRRAYGARDRLIAKGLSLPQVADRIIRVYETLRTDGLRSLEDR